ncbi:MAG: hypothetical protein U0441_37105 [Polyangiaceae bacterium]
MSHSRPAVGVQIMLGVYRLFQEREVGQLYVEELAGPTKTREHWILYGAYRWPSAEYPTQQLTFRYQGPPADLSEFLKGAPSGSTYVVADCSQQTLP